LLLLLTLLPQPETQKLLLLHKPWGWCVIIITRHGAAVSAATVSTAAGITAGVTATACVAATACVTAAACSAAVSVTAAYIAFLARLSQLLLLLLLLCLKWWWRQ
jgi:hypothetical protein